MPPAVVTRRAISTYATEKKVNETVAIMKAAGTEMPMPRPESGSLNIIAASGADPVTMQNRICGSPSAFRASSVDPVTPFAAGAGALVASMQSPFGLDPSRRVWRRREVKRTASTRNVQARYDEFRKTPHEHASVG